MQVGDDTDHFAPVILHQGPDAFADSQTRIVPQFARHIFGDEGDWSLVECFSPSEIAPRYEATPNGGDVAGRNKLVAADGRQYARWIGLIFGIDRIV